MTSRQAARVPSTWNRLKFVGNAAIGSVTVPPWARSARGWGLVAASELSDEAPCVGGAVPEPARESVPSVPEAHEVSTSARLSAAAVRCVR
ncbi:hypothetical protein [Mobilicoccus caccae]|uniref:hypothetical protein n=1 Tax=Mobilicoccus caccae TaxID=1859295 RepID=UPI0032AF3BCB